MLGFEESVVKAKDGIKVELINEDEGFIDHGCGCGSYVNSTDYLTFYVFKNKSRTSDADAPGWEHVENWCSCLTADMSEEKTNKALNLIFDEFYNAMKDDLDVLIHHLGDTLSELEDSDII